jgi:hypothetical protein
VVSPASNKWCMWQEVRMWFQVCFDTGWLQLQSGVILKHICVIVRSMVCGGM